jgi:hypothetical protein
MTIPPRCAPFREWQTRQGPHLLRSPEGDETWVNWSQEWWAWPIMKPPEATHALGWRYIGLPMTAAEATAMVRARDGLAARLITTQQENTALRARLQHASTALDNIAALTTTQAPPAALHDAVSVALASARADLERGA